MRFSFPSTELRFFSSHAEWKKALAAKSGYSLIDRGSGVRAPSAFLLNGGEREKSWQRLERVLIWLAEKNAERSEPLVVIGGGAVLDLGAFAASLYRRGMPLVLVPTTLLAMVDATLGGKTAVDLRRRGRLQKNFAGTFYPAASVWILPDFLATLPRRERLSGAGECWKMLWLYGKGRSDQALVDYVETGKVGPELLALIRFCLRAKARVVKQDPLDNKRIREALNFGHTIGHALESQSRLSHGEAVLWGMAVESQLKGTLAPEVIDVLRALGLRLPLALRKPKQKAWKAALRADKKNRGGKIELTIAVSPGKRARLRVDFPILWQALQDFPAAFQRAGARPRA